MILFPATDLFGGKAVRLFKGEYSKMTVYSNDPASVASDFVKCGASHIHIVDLEGAKDGTTPNLETVLKIKKTTGMFCEVGGGIRSREVIDRYLRAGIDRVILGTAAVNDRELLYSAVAEYGKRIAVSADIKDGFVAVRGWTEKTDLSVYDFCDYVHDAGVRTVICTDVSRDGAMQGTNLDLYSELSEKYSLDFIASGGVSSMEDIVRLKEMGMYGAIIGKAYYTKAIDLKKAVEVAEHDN